MERKALEQLLKWKIRRKRNPMILTGARGCGKTFLAKKFGKENFEETAYFDLEENKELRAVLERETEGKQLLKELESAAGKAVVPGKTLVLFDELEACPQALQAIAKIREELPELHVLAVGTLLDAALKKAGIPFPEAGLERMELFPLSFEEFVIADGGENHIQSVMQLTFGCEIPESTAKPLEDYLTRYLIVGGMPAAVQAWTETHDYAAAEEVQERIMEGYDKDFAKFSSGVNTKKSRLLWDAIPTQLARENNKFIYTQLKAGARAKDLEDALQWIVDAGIAHKQYFVSEPQYPLSRQADKDYFKVYLADVGLLRRKAGISFKAICENGAAYRPFKAALTENYVYQQLKAMGIETWFWRTKANAEIGFITEEEGAITPIEVRNADNTKAKSLQLFCDRYAPKAAFKTSLKNVGERRENATHVWSIPLYILFRLKGYILHEVGWPS